MVIYVQIDSQEAVKYSSPHVLFPPLLPSHFPSLVTVVYSYSFRFMSTESDTCDCIRLKRLNNSIKIQQLLPLPLVVVKCQPRGNKQNSFNVVSCIIGTQPQLTLVLTCQVEHVLTCLRGLKVRPKTEILYILFHV